MRQSILVSLARIVALASALIIPSLSFAAEQSPKNLVVDRFEEASLKDLLGGYIGSDTSYPGICRVSFSWNPNNTFGKAMHSLKVDYDVRSAGSYSYVWLHLGPEIRSGQVQTVDLRGYAYLSFWVKSSKVWDNFKIELHCDTNANGRYDPLVDQASGIYVDRYFGQHGLTQEWRKVVIPLEDFRDITDLSRAMEIVAVFENLRGNRQGTITVDDVLFGINKVPGRDKLKLPIPKTLPAIRQAQTLKYLLSAEWKNVEGVEGIGFEGSWDGGRNWFLAGIDYDSSDGASIVWNAPPLPSSGSVQFRCFALAVDGRRATDFSGAVGLDIARLSDEQLWKELAHRAFLYFADQQHPDTGLFLDTEGGNASTAVAGFGLAALVIGAQERWMDHKTARQRALQTLQTYAILQQGESVAQKLQEEKARAQASQRGPKGALEDMLDFQTTFAIGGGILSTLANTPQALSSLLFGSVPPSKDGFFYHFMKPGTAERAGTSEISVVDTGLLLMGALAAGEYFGGDVKTLARKIFDRVHWDKFYDPQTKCFRMGWSPERGYFDACWDYYTDEAILIHLLAAGSQTWRVPEDSFYSFRREKGRVGDGEEFIYSWSGALFTHQYASAWIDLRQLQDKQGCNWWENSRRATLAARDFCWFSKDRPQAYGPHRWGISSFQRPEGYVMHFGILPNGSQESQEDGTISPIACAASMGTIPFEAASDLKFQLAQYPFLFHRYGLRNSYNLQRDWFSSLDFGLDTGLLLLTLENFRNGLVWNATRKSPVIQRGLTACGFSPIPWSKQALHYPVLLPPLPAGAKGAIIKAQECVAEMETLWQRADAAAYAAYLQKSKASYRRALALLAQAPKDNSALHAHAEWLAALIALRRMDIGELQKHLAEMLRIAKWPKTRSPEERMTFLQPYLSYVSATDARDFLEDLYTSFLQEVSWTRNGVHVLESFADECRQRKRYALAERAWTDALNLPAQKEKAKVLFHLAKLQEGMKSYAKALEHLQAMLKERPAGPLLESAQLSIAVNKLLMRKDSQTAEDLERFLQKYPASALRDDAALKLGIAYFQSKRYDLAKKCFLSVSSSDQEMYERAQSHLVKIQ